MSFLGDLGLAGAGGALGLLQGAVGYSQQKKLMSQQQEYNKEMAAINQQNAKEMWDYTNFENQKSHLENAGLNAALLYGMGGAGGASTHGGTGSSGGAPQAQQPSMIAGLSAGMQMKQLELQEKQTEADIRLKESEARRNDQEVTESQSRITVNNSLAKLNDANRATKDSEVFLNYAKGTEALRNADKVDAEGRLTEKQLEWYDKLTGATIDNIVSKTDLNYKQQKMLNAEMWKISEDVRQRGEEIQIEQQNADTNKTRIDTEAAWREFQKEFEPQKLQAQIEQWAKENKIEMRGQNMQMITELIKTFVQGAVNVYGSTVNAAARIKSKP